MGIPREDELATTTLEETLPLYEESHHHSLFCEIPTPESKSSPDQVRNFLVQILQQRGVELHHANRIAARWTIGTGRELRTYPVSMYRNVFGPDDAWVVYKEVKTHFYRDEYAKSPNPCSRTTEAILLLAAIVSMMLMVWVCTTTSSSLLFGGAVVVMFFSFVAFLVFAQSLSEPSDPDEKAEVKAENELHEQWPKTPDAAAQG